MSLTCPQHRSKAPGASHGDAQRRVRGGTATHQGDPGYHEGADDAGHAEHDMLNGDAVRPRILDRSGVQEPHTACHWAVCLVVVLCSVEFVTGGCDASTLVSLTTKQHHSAVSSCR